MAKIFDTTFDQTFREAILNSITITTQSTKTVQIKATKEGMTDSAIATYNYAVYDKVATPVITDEGSGQFSIACSTSGAAIYYTTNGDTPTTGSTLYSAPVTLEATATVKAKAFKTNWTPSDVDEQLIAVAIDITLPQSANVIRAWSLRRNVAAVGTGACGKIDRATDAQTGDDFVEVNFASGGKVVIPNGDDAYLSMLYSQVGTSTLEQATYTKCPKVLASNVVLDGWQYDGSTSNKAIGLAGEDSAIATAMTLVADPAHLPEISYSLWFKSVGVANNRALVYAVGGATWGYLILQLNASGQLVSYFRSASSLTYTGATYDDNVWHMVTITAKGDTSAANGHKIYVDGAYKAQENVRAISNATGAFTIGNNPAATQSFSGLINDIIFWNKELTDTEVAALYNAQKGYYGIE